jgi:hypothetical protein
MSTVEHRSVAALAQRAGSGPPRRVIITLITAGLLLAWMAGARTASSLRDSAAKLASQDYAVTATVALGQTKVTGRPAFRSAVATWTYPVGVKHSAAVTVSVASPQRQQVVWVDASGAATPGPPSPLGIAGDVALTAIPALLMTALAIAAVTVASPLWRRHRLQAAVDARWRDLAQHLWEDL